MPRQISEKLTRKEMIDSQLETAGWQLCDHSKVKIEIPVDGYDAEPWNGVTDYCLYRENGEVLAMDGTEAEGLDASTRSAQAAARNAYHEDNDEWASAEYRMDVAATLAKRCLEALNI